VVTPHLGLAILMTSNLRSASVDPTTAHLSMRLMCTQAIRLQDGQTKMRCSRRTPSFEIVRKCFMVSPQERHTMVGRKQTRAVATALWGMGEACL
jgi:hypothetical protein